MTYQGKKRTTVRVSADTDSTTKLAPGNNAAVTTASTAESPLDYILRVMRDPSQDEERRDAMAKAALPYMHARLTSVDGQILDNEGETITFTWQPPQK